MHRSPAFLTLASFSFFHLWFMIFFKNFSYAQTLYDGFHQIKEVTIKEIPSSFKNTIFFHGNVEIQNHVNPLGGYFNGSSPGDILFEMKEIVALGEDIYRLVVKGKPSNTTTYSPISVLPKINSMPVDIFQTEGWNRPESRTFEIIYKNIYNINVVKFRYSLIYSYGGSYYGKGKYLTALQIVPVFVYTSFGFDFNATMKLGGIQNLGSGDDPIAGATVLLEYSVSSIMNTIQRVDKFFITGNGDSTEL